jgi:FHA domain
MWFLKEEATRGKQHTPTRYWFGGIGSAPRTIGRKNVDIRLNASSVSRTHATIRVLPSSFSRPRGTIPTVEDSSAYGTFLKYPSGHPANRASQQDGHHDRLNKEQPMEIQEGALLAFGAPSAWWRVGWCPILLCPMPLESRQTSRLHEVVTQTGLAVSSGTGTNWSEVTHVVTPLGRASSPRFLRAIVEGKFIVTPAWIDAVANMVNDACKTASTAANLDAAVAATAIPSEDSFTPSFCEEDVAAFDQNVLNKAFDGTVERNTLFTGVTFVFTDDARLSHWNLVLEACGARAVLASSTNISSSRLVHVRPVSANGEGAMRVDMAHFCAEPDIIRAILSADAESIRKLSQGLATSVSAPAPIADVATPAPSDSDAETADNEAVETDTVPSRQKRPRSELEPEANSERADAEDNRYGGKGFDESRNEEGVKSMPRQSPADGPAAQPDFNAVDNDDVNPRWYFSAGPPALPSVCSSAVCAADAGNQGVPDVRPFKRRQVAAPQRRIGLVKVRASDGAAGHTAAAFVNKSTVQNCPRAVVEDSQDDDDDDV